MDTDVRYRLDEDGIGWITFDGPEVLNAISPVTMLRLVEALDQADFEARVIVLTGEGRAFSSGGHLGKTPDNPNPADIQRRARSLDITYHRAILRMRDLETPIISAVNGLAIGGSTPFAFGGDLVIASEDAYFMISFQRLGIGPDVGSAYMLTRAIGRARAAELFLLGDRFTAQQAYEWGLVTHVVPAAEFEATVHEYAIRLADGPARTLGLIRRLLWRAQEGTLEEELEREYALSGKLVGKPENLEGIAAFAERRKPDFRSLGG